MITIFAVSDLVWIAILTPIGGCASALLVGWQLNRQLREQKSADIERTDEVARLQEEARVELAKEDEQKRADAKQVAEVVTEAARQLAMAQDRTIAGTDEVARKVAVRGGEGSSGSSSSRYPNDPKDALLAVIISHPSGYRREVFLDGIPSKGDYVLLRGAEPDSQPMVVADYPLWIESNGQNSPSVIIIVTPRKQEVSPAMELAVEKEESNQKQDGDG